MATVEGLAQMKAAFHRMPAAVKNTIEEALNKGADEMVERAKAICPVNELDPHPGALQASIHKEAGRINITARRRVVQRGVSRPLSVAVVADARDAQGNCYGLHVELGHKMKGGGHVPAKPFFYTTWRVLKKRLVRRIARAINQSVKAEMARGRSSE